MSTKTRAKRKARKHRSAAQRANDKRLGQMARARHRGKATKVRVKRRKSRAHKRRARRAVAAVVINPTKRRRSRRRGRRGGARAKHRRAKTHARRGRSRGRHRRARRRSLRIVSINPMSSVKKGLASYFAGFQVGRTMKAVTGNGWKGYAFAAGGAVGTVFVGTLLARMVMPAMLKMAPTVFGSPMGARALSFGMYYTGGWAIAKFTPGLSQSSRDAILFGTLVASVLEIVKPGLIATAVSKVPVIGEMIAGHLDGIESELADYVDEALQGLGFSTEEYDGTQGVHGAHPGLYNRPGSRLSDYAMAGVGDYAMAGVGDYTEINGVGNYAMAGLGCPAADRGASGG